MKYTLIPGKHFLRMANKLTQGNSKLQNNLRDSLRTLEDDPRNKKLHTHKVLASYDKKQAFASRVTGDIRILWRFDSQSVRIIDLIDLGGHSGKNKVYI